MKLNTQGDFHIVGLNNTPQSHDGPRINDLIRADSVRCIGADGEQLGVIPISEALEMAENLYKGQVSKSGVAILPSKRTRRIPESKKPSLADEALSELKAEQPEIKEENLDERSLAFRCQMKYSQQLQVGNEMPALFYLGMQMKQL